MILGDIRFLNQLANLHSISTSFSLPSIRFHFRFYPLYGYKNVLDTTLKNAFSFGTVNLMYVQVMVAKWPPFGKELLP